VGGTESFDGRTTPLDWLGGSMRATVSLLAIFVLALGAIHPARAGAQDVSPEDTLKRYLGALQKAKFEETYDLVSSGMKRDRATGAVKSKEVWVKESQYVMQFSEAKIFDFRVFPGKVEGEKATVPNILSSQDKFLNQLGVEEYELYTLVKEDGKWKVDQQRIAEGPEIAKWFPKEAAAGAQTQK
jgi:hypothetical protein